MDIQRKRRHPLQMSVRQVEYNGYVFRSQIEAKWAMVFDKLDIEYLYENETYQLSHQNRRFGYLIDFVLPQLKRFIEIKNMGSIPPTENECLKAKCLAEQNEYKYPCTILFGPISTSQNYKHGSARTYHSDGQISMPQLLTECPYCGHIDFCTDGLLKHMSCRCEQKYPDEQNHKSTRLISVLQEVRKHRFWNP